MWQITVGIGTYSHNNEPRCCAFSISSKYYVNVTLLRSSGVFSSIFTKYIYTIAGLGPANITERHSVYRAH